MKNAPKPSIKYLKDKICKIKQIQNIPVTRETFLNQSKKKTNLKKQYNFCKDMISSEFRDMS